MPVVIKPSLAEPGLFFSGGLGGVGANDLSPGKVYSKLPSVGHAFSRALQNPGACP